MTCALPIFLRCYYDVTEYLNVFVEGNYGKATANWDQYYNYTYATAAPTIYANNAFLPDVIRDRMADEGIASFRLGRIHSESMIRAENKKEMWRVATGFTATPGDRKSTRLNSSH